MTCQGCSQIASIAATIEGAGGPAAFNEKLAIMMDTAGRVGGSQELATLLQGTQELMREAGGAGACVQMLKDGGSLARAAGGAEQVRIHYCPTP